MSSIVGLAVESILFGAIGLVGFNLIADATIFSDVNQSGYSVITSVIQTVVPLIIGVAALLIFLKRAGYTLKM